MEATPTLETTAPEETDTSDPEQGLPYTPRGTAVRLLRNKQPELLITGPAGTGKSLACLYKLHTYALKYPGFRALIVRKTRASLSKTGLVSFERYILGPAHPAVAGGPSRSGRFSYRYTNGSEIETGGLDSPGRVLSAEYDMIYVQQAEEIREEEWEILLSRLRNGAIKLPDGGTFHQIFADSNPDRPTHWLRLRKGLVTLESRHEDNPLLYDEQAGEWTEAGKEYIGKLDRLTGVRKQRLRYGKWVQAENAVLEEWVPSEHLVDRFDIPKDWRRFLAIDFGYTAPFTCQWWAIDPDGGMWLYRQLYFTHKRVSEHAQVINRYRKLEKEQGCRPLEAIVCDHDAEGRATLEADCGFRTMAASKAVKEGIDKLKERLAGRRLHVLRDGLIAADPDLVEAGLPTCLEQEVEGYVWALDKEVPVGDNDHGIDAARYAVMYLDRPKAKAPVLAPMGVASSSKWRR